MSIPDDTTDQAAAVFEISSGRPVSVASEAPPARFAIDLANTGVAHLADFTFYDAYLNGSLPHAFGAHGPLSFAKVLPTAEDLVAYFPTDVTIQRSITTEQSIETLGSGDNYIAQLCFSSAWFALRVAAKSPEIARTVGQAMSDSLPHPAEKQEDPARVGVHIWKNVGGRCQTREEVVVAPAWEEIANHYTASTRAQLAELMVLAPIDGVLGSGRIVLFTGPPGVGKTSAIKTLARAWAAWSIFEAVQYPEQVFNDSEYLDEVTGRLAPQFIKSSDARTFRTVVIEDVDHFVGMDARSGGEPAIGRILNVADGWTGAGNLLIVLSSNLPSSQMHPAITRPGRCLADISFGLLKPKEAKQILARGSATPKSDLALSDVFEQHNGPAISKAMKEETTAGYL